MKKLTRLVVSVVLLLTLAFSLSGCMLTNGGVYVEDGLSSQISTPSDSGNPPIVYNESVIMARGSENENDRLSVIDAVKKVERTAVAIYTETGAGSGVIVDMNYEKSPTQNYVYIITCHHIISDMGKIEVAIPDEDCSYVNVDYVFEGEIGPKIYNDKAVTLVGGDLNTDIAVIKIDITKPAKSGKILTADKIVKAKIPSKDYKLEKGEMVFSIGNPTGGLPGSVATGEISYLERTVSVEVIGDMLLTQISVTTNPGNSGGGLYNLYGELIGITNAGNTNYQAINFAIPFSLSNGNGFVNVASQLLGTATSTNYGCILGTKQKFGFSVFTLTNGTNTFLAVSEVAKGGLAEKAGIKINDIINTVKLEGEEEIQITNSTDFMQAMNQLQVGESIIINVTRQVSNYKTQDINITLTAKQFWFCNTGK